ncbi:MAG: tubulin-like doman-containing protein, partial [Clostridiales bacterium]|nr:tubulin-like doman-containing protein [Clostridiales bacterium]
MAEKKEEGSLLERSLSLSKNGGIYYGGARVNADPRRAVLFVGLGGSGADALLRIKDQVKTRMLLPSDKTGAPVADTPKNVGFLEVDTDESVQKVGYGNARFDPFGNEFCNISVPDKPEVIREVKKKKKAGVECWQWFDDDVNAVAGANGASGIRQIGRMLLASNIDKVVGKVESKIRLLTEDNPDITGLNIYVFSGISGGTGAGTFLDMAYILRKVAKEHNPDVNLLGYLIMTDVNELNGGNREALRTNGFACLKELEYWMSAGEHEDVYYQKFPNGYVLEERCCPFDFCHLLDSADINGHSFNYDKILRSVAENVFAYIAGEADGGTAVTGSMAQMYDNIQTYIRTLTANAQYPACYNYLSLGAAKIEIPYTEISTLIAARVFDRLDRGMFQNRPTQDSFNMLVHRELGVTEQNIRSELYRLVAAPRPALDPGSHSYGYGDVWPNNAPYNAAYNWLALFQRSAVQQAGNLPSVLEGRLREFIRTNLKDRKTGPVYLRYFVKSDQDYCLYHMLGAFKKYCNDLTIQCGGNSHDLNEIMQQRYVEGQGVRGGRKQKIAVQNYLDAVRAWYTNEEAAFLNQRIVEIIEKVQARLELYYNQILRPLTDILLELPGIFQKNVEYIKVNESRPTDEGTNILIRPLEFERDRRNDFNAAVLQAENQFLESLSGNIRKWIGRDIDEVDEKIVGNADVAGFISNFISENFQALLTINMEDIMQTSRLKPGEGLPDYIKMRVDDLLANSFPMYKESAGLAGTAEDFAIISVPVDCPTIYKVTKDYIAEKGLSRRIQVKKSEEKSRMYIIKIASGYPLYSNAYIGDMEKAYEGKAGNLTINSGRHLKPEWGERLASPYIEPAWKAPYTCRHTRERNKEYRGYFDRCYANGIIVRNGESFWLKRANPEVAAQVSRASLSANTILGKMEQFEKIKRKLWDGSDMVKLSSCSGYMMEQNDTEGALLNVRENILRFPLLLDILKEECELSDRIDTIEEELHYPRYFALANMNHMIYMNKLTGDTVYRRTKEDPFPVKLANGSEMHPDYKDYQIYERFCRTLNPEMKEEIDLQFDNLKNRIQMDAKALESYVAEIRDSIKTYKAQAEKARNEMYNTDRENRPAFLARIEFYQGICEELTRMLPIGEEAEEKPAVRPQPVVEEVSAAPVRYLDPGTWQPIMSPQPGQQVFDTQTRQTILYQPEAPRYLDPQRGWQPVMNPQPGQQVF